MIKIMMDTEELQEVSEGDLGLVRDILKTLTKTLKTFNVYPRDNPIYQKFATDLFEKFSLFFESGDELSLDVEQYSLLFKGTEVLHSEERTDNIALLLFADGIRQINFYKGLTPEEITDLIDILRVAPKSDDNDDDDIVTLLWEKNIKNMGYTAVEDVVDEDLVVEESFFADEPQPAEEALAQTFAVLSGEVSSQGTSSVSRLGNEPAAEEELESVQKEMNDLDEEALLSAATGLFFDLLSLEPHTDAFPEVIQNFAKVVQMKIQNMDIQGVMYILRRLKEFAGADSSRMEQIDAVIERAGSTENLRVLFSAARDGREIREYLGELGRSSISSMVEVLGELQDRRQRRLLCEVLAVVGRDGIGSLSGGLDDDRWYLVRNIAMILGMTKNPEAVQPLGKILGHDDLRVRREAVRALDGIHTDETKPLFLAAFRDPDLTVRTTALRALRRFRDPALFEIVKEKASFDELKKKTLAEKKEMTETLAALGGENAFPILSDLFRKRGFIEKEDVTEIRAAAAYGLGMLGTPEAVELLGKESGSRKELLREACLKALRESRQSGNND